MASKICLGTDFDGGLIISLQDVAGIPEMWTELILILIRALKGNKLIIRIETNTFP